jgi:hypothetical protein
MNYEKKEENRYGVKPVTFPSEPFHGAIISTSPRLTI